MVTYAVDAEAILWGPSPRSPIEMPDASSAAPPMTADELLVRQPPHASTELVRGRMIVREPPSLRHGVVAARLLYLLAHHVYAHGLGVVCAQDTGFHLFSEPDTVRAPDVAFIRTDRVGSIPETGYGRVVPDLVVEIRSPGDRPRALSARVADWLAAGVALLWVIDVPQRRAQVHRPGRATTHIAADGTLDGDGVVPGFRCRLADVLT